jgi:hypothetical protein
MTQQPNTLFQEIEEDLNRQKMEALWKRYGVWVMAFAAAVILGTSGVTAWDSWRAQQQQTATAGLADILSNSAGDDSKEIEALETFASKNRGETQSALARLHAAALAAKNGDTKKAVGIYDELAGDTKADPAFRQLADLYSVQAQMDGGDPVALQLRLNPLMADNAPWRYATMETSAFLALHAGDKAKAKQLFIELSQDNGAPQTLAARADDMARFIGE